MEARRRAHSFSVKSAISANFSPHCRSTVWLGVLRSPESLASTPSHSITASGSTLLECSPWIETPAIAHATPRQQYEPSKVKLSGSLFEVDTAKSLNPLADVVFVHSPWLRRWHTSERSLPRARVLFPEKLPQTSAGDVCGVFWG